MDCKSMKFGEILALKYDVDMMEINNALLKQKSLEYQNLKLGEILKLNNVINDDLINKVLIDQGKIEIKKDENLTIESTIEKNILEEDEKIFIEENIIEEDEEVSIELDYKNMKIGEILNKKFHIPRDIIEEGLLKQKKIFNNKRKIGTILTEDGLISRDILYHAYALQKDIKYINYNKIKQRIDFKIYKDEKIYKAFNQDSYIPLLYTIKNAKAIPMYWDKNEETNKDRLIIGITELGVADTFLLTDTITNYLLKQDIEVEVYITSEKLYTDFELKYKELSLEELENFSKKIPEITAETFLKYLLIYSILRDVSDIHIFPSSNNYARIAVRILSSIETLFYIPLSDYDSLVSVIKNNADMKADKMSVPQDGRIDGKKILKDVTINVNRTNNVENEYNINENKLDYNFENVTFRVSSYPREHAYEMKVGATFEKVVIRILNLSSGLVELSELGLNSQTTKELNYVKSRNQGIIFVVGPTGSGKSTTIYSALSSINALKKNIISFEDPVEMQQLYWTQGQRKTVKDNEDMNFDYLQAKKSILRQDPDIILMGEVRDEESANFAIEAANTGHLVFTTLHSNSAAAAFERIKKLDVKPLEIASATLCVLSQRLVKEVCPHCKKIRKINNDEIDTLSRLEYNGEIPKKIIEVNVDGCKYCNFKGYIGRSTLSEIIPISSKIKEAIVNEKPDYIIRKIANELGYKTILEDGLDKMKEGKVALEDIFNII